MKLFPPLSTWTFKGSDAQNVALFFEIVFKLQKRFRPELKPPQYFRHGFIRIFSIGNGTGLKDIGAYLVQDDPYIDWLARYQSCSPFKWHVMVFQLVNRLAPFWPTFCQLKIEVIVGSCFEGLGAVCIGLVS